MGITLRPPTASVHRRIAAPPETVWRLLTDVRQWSRWGPSVRGAVLDGGGWQLGPETRGEVRTVTGIWLPFTVTDFEAGRRWNWTVAGVPATGHTVTASGDGCRLAFEVPWLAVAYLPVCAVALGRIERLAGETVQRQ